MLGSSLPYLLPGEIAMYIRADQSKLRYGPYPARANATSSFIIKDNAGNLIQFFGR
jgi:hypothetical protein